jgi:hypothetical protein
MMSDEFVPLEKLLPFLDPECDQKIVEMFSDASLDWWRKSLACLRPPPPDDEGRRETTAAEAE